MEYVTLAPGLPGSSRLGLGCGSVMGRVGKNESLRAIAAALDAGITHFDVARSYGYGEAEALLGEALRGKREQVVLASKFGLSAPRAASALRRLKPLVQSAVAAIPGLRPLVRAALGTRTLPADRFSIAAARSSLEQSLAALATDYLDILFLHDCDAADASDELLGFLEAQVASGKIRAYGAATAVDTIAALIDRHGDRMLYQFANGVCVRGAETLPRGARRFVAHSPFSGAERLRASLAASGAVRLADGRALQSDMLAELMLGWALAADNVGVVVCSMLNPAHRQANLAAIERPRFIPADLAAFADFAAAAA
jgi:aryl-alcohol dehydrogenase-like predicted oxidoreductase